jgi:hypothetical protein
VSEIERIIRAAFSAILAHAQSGVPLTRILQARENAVVLGGLALVAAVARSAEKQAKTAKRENYCCSH